MKLLLAALATLLPYAVWACSCIPMKEAGFVHSNLKHLPVNARGALFLTEDPQLKASSFLITSDTDTGPLPAGLSWPDLHEKAQRYLARVAPVGGFKPGTHYTVAYRNASRDWRYPARTDFFIDSAPLDLANAETRLMLDSGPTRQLLELETNGGSCGSQQPATVQNFHYDLPDTYLPYRTALYYDTEYEGDHPEPYFPSLCGQPPFGATRLGGQRDMVHSSCSTPRGRFAIRGRVALLEVEDRPRATNTVQVNLATPQGLSCTPFGILKEVLASRNSGRITNAACNINRTEWWAASSGIPHDLPSESDILTLIHANQGVPPTCTLQALTAVLTHTPAPARTLGNAIGRMIADELLTSNEQTIDAALAQLDETTTYIDLNGFHQQEYVGPHLEAVLAPLRPALIRLRASGKQLPTRILNALPQ